MANPLAPLENPPTPTIVPLICKARVRVPPKPTLLTPPLFFQLVPLMPFVPESITLSTFRIQGPSLVMNDRICLVPLVTKSPSITIEHAQPHGWKTI